MEKDHCFGSELPDEVRACAIEHASTIDGDELKITHQPSCISLPQYSTEDLLKLQTQDKYVGRVMELFRKGQKLTTRQLQMESPVTSKLLKKWSQLCFMNDVFYRKIILNASESFQLVLPRNLKSFVLKHLHDLVGHQGIERILSLVQSRCFGPSMVKDVTDYVKRCERCFILKEPHIKLRSKMCPLSVKNPLDTIAIDFTVLEKSSNALEKLLQMSFPNSLRHVLLYIRKLLLL